MVRKLLFRFEVALIAMLQLWAMAYTMIGLAEAFGQTASSNDAAQERKFEDFLNRFETNVSTTELPTEYETLAADIAGYRIIKSASPALIVEQADQAFRAECAIWNGRIEPVKDHIQMMSDYYEYRDQRTPDPFYGMKPVICLDRVGQSLGALATSKTRPMKNGDAWATIILFSRKGTTDMLLAYYNGEQRRAELPAQKERALIAWRQALMVGDATQCGSVIELRGPMVQLASGSRTAWMRREELFPNDRTVYCSLQ
jgi:hypothetical protein